MIKWTHKLFKHSDIEDLNQAEGFINIGKIIGNCDNIGLHISLYCSIRKIHKAGFQLIIENHTQIHEENDPLPYAGNNDSFPIYVEKDIKSVEEAQKIAETKIKEFLIPLKNNIDKLLKN